MTKRQLYGIIGVLLIVLVYVLFMPVQKEEEHTNVSIEKDAPHTVTTTEVSEEEGHVTQEVQKSSSTPEAESAETVMLEGVFIGFVDGSDIYKKKFKYLLLNDGTEVLRIDLRPLIGYSNKNIAEKLNIERGTPIQVQGIMQDGEFKVRQIQ